MVYVVIGATQLTKPGPGAQLRRIKKLVLHENYNKNDKSNDIALLQLSKPVECNPYTQLACMADPSLSLSDLQNCWVAGWGAVTARGEFPRETPGPYQHTGDMAWASPQQRLKPGCRMYTLAEMDLAHSSKTGSWDTASKVDLQRESQTLGMGLTAQAADQNWQGNRLGFFLFCSQLKTQVISYKRQRSSSSMFSSATVAAGMQGKSTPTTCVLVTQKAKSTPAR